MTKTRRILLFTLLSAVLGGFAWLLLSQPREPVYQGRPLLYWCEQYDANYFSHSGDELARQAETAIRTIGTNAIPTLLRWLKTRDSKVKVKLLELSQKLRLFNLIWSADTWHSEAATGFYCLGPRAQSAVPALLEIYNQHDDDLYDTPANISRIIGSIGPAAADAVPQLVRDTTDPDEAIRWDAIIALDRIHARPDLAVPALTKCLHDPDDVVQLRTAYALSAYGSDAKAAVPELIKALANATDDDDLRNAIATALKKINPAAATKAGVK